MVDTGADVSVLPRRLVPNASHVTTTDFNLYTATGGKIETYGKKSLLINLGLRRQFRWEFYICNVSHALLGSDFLKHYKLLVDVANNQLIDSTTNLTTLAQQTRLTHSMSIHFIPAVLPKNWSAILQKYQTQLTQQALENCANGTEHVIEITPNTKPTCCKVRRLPPQRYKEAKREFQQMMSEGICRPSNSPWASPLHLVPKKNGQLRPCGDYRRLNATTVPDRYPVPNMQDCIYTLEKKTIFSTLDIVRAYNQIKVADESIPKTAVITPFGLFEFLRMPFGLRNAAQTFQRFMDQILRGLDFVFVYIDDILIASQSEKEHVEHLSTVLDRLAANAVHINIEKCKFGQTDVNFLGFRITAEGIAPTTEKVEAVANYQRPSNITELRRFLGFINFYRRHLTNAAELQAPLHNFLQNKTKKNDKSVIEWDETTSRAFDKCKESLASAATLTFPTNGSLMLTCDASETCIGAVLQNDNNSPIGFFSKKLSNTEKKYSTYDRELLAIYSAVAYFRVYIEGRHVTIKTDHKPLTFAFKTTHAANSRETNRRARQLEYISQFTTDIEYIKGEENAAADALSRVQEVTYTCAINYEEIAKVQARDEELKDLRDNPEFNFEELQLPALNVHLTCETTTGKFRPYIPDEFRRTVYASVHNLSHPGTRATRKLLTEKFFWPAMNKDTTEWAKTCIHCQKAKVTRHTKSNFTAFPAPKARFSCVHLDLIGPLPLRANFRYCLTLIDRYSHWPEVVPVTDIRAETVVRAIFTHWIARFGTPELIITDRGTQFESSLFQAFNTLFGIKRIRTTAYHPQSNGKIERFHRTLKTSIMAHAEHDWTLSLPVVLLGIRTALRGDSNYSAAEIMYGEALRLPSEMFEPNQNYPPMDLFMQHLKDRLKEIRPDPTKWNAKQRPFVNADLQNTTHIFLREDGVKKPLRAPYSGPYKVENRTENTMCINVNGKTTTVSIDRVKPAYILNEETQPIVEHDHSYATVQELERPPKRVHFATTTST